MTLRVSCAGLRLFLPGHEPNCNAYFGDVVLFLYPRSGLSALPPDSLSMDDHK